MSLQTLLEGWCGPIPELAVCGLALDSRKVTSGEAFVAVAGASAHGLAFAAQAEARGASVVLHDGLAPVPALGIPAVRIDGLGGLLSRLGSRFYHAPSDRLSVVGVTGTNGKTSTAHFIAQAWQRDNGHAGLIGTVGWGAMNRLQAAELTTPDPISVQRMLAACLEQGVDRVAMEVSSHALEQGRCADVAFAAAVFTNLSRDHLDYHGTMEEYAQAKRRLFTDCRPGFAIINGDDPFGRSLIGELAGRAEVLSYGIDGPVELRASVLGMDASGIRLRLAGPWGEGDLHCAVLGRFNVYNLLAAAGALALLGMPWDRVLHQLELMQPVPGRMRCMGGERGQPVVVVDFAHTPDALEHALLALRAHLHGRLVCVFGCGGNRDRGKRPMMAALAERLADRVILTTDNPRRESPQDIFADMLAGMRNAGSATVITDRAAAIREAIRASRPGDIVLIAGKGHEAYQETSGQRLPFSDEAAARSVLEEAA